MLGPVDQQEEQEILARERGQRAAAELETRQPAEHRLDVQGYGEVPRGGRPLQLDDETVPRSQERQFVAVSQVSTHRGGTGAAHESECGQDRPGPQDIAFPHHQVEVRRLPKADISVPRSWPRRPP